MKLVNTLAVAFLGALLATGCTVTDDTSNDGATWFNWRMSLAPLFCSVSAVTAETAIRSPRARSA